LRLHPSKATQWIGRVSSSQCGNFLFLCAYGSDPIPGGKSLLASSFLLIALLSIITAAYKTGYGWLVGMVVGCRLSLFGSILCLSEWRGLVCIVYSNRWHLMSTLDLLREKQLCSSYGDSITVLQFMYSLQLATYLVARPTAKDRFFPFIREVGRKKLKR
jgi:hypothetical protein